MLGAWLGRLDGIEPSLGRTMDFGGLEEGPFPTRDRILLVMGGNPPMGLVPTPKECRTRIALDLGILIIPTTGLISASFI